MELRIQIHTTAVTRRDIVFMLSRLVDLDMYLYRSRSLPPLYQSGVRYRAEHEDFTSNRPVEDWLAVDVLYERGCGDCEDLAAARCAELRLQGIAAYPRLRKTGRIWHVVVESELGWEDPSKELGMKGAVA